MKTLESTHALPTIVQGDSRENSIFLEVIVSVIVKKKFI